MRARKMPAPGVTRRTGANVVDSVVLATYRRVAGTAAPLLADAIALID